MCKECQRRSLAAVYRTGRRRTREEIWSVPCRHDDRLTDLVIRSAPVTEEIPSAPIHRKSKRSTRSRREVR
jgi:hypothetical protein